MADLPVVAYFFGAPGPLELVIIALVILLLFGSRLPRVMGNLGKSIVEFKKGIKGADEDENQPEQNASDSSRDEKV